MEYKIETGEYVRTKEGLIGKIKEFNPHYTKGKREGQEVEENYLLMGKEQCKFIESIDYRIPPCYPSDEEWEKIKKHIVKHSKQLIDLIEVGDIVEDKYNKYEVAFVKDDKIYCNDYNFDDSLITLREQHIKEILAREQFEANCYKVGEEDESTR